MFIAVLFIIAKTWKPPKCQLTEEWIKKMYGVCVYMCARAHVYTHTHTHTHTHTRILSAMKKNEIMPLQQHGWT